MGEFEEKSADWYESFEQTLADADCDINAAEFQGILVGMISAGLEFDDKRWFNTILEVANQGNPIPEVANNELKLIFTQSQKAFQQQDELAPILLPGDDYPLIDRVEALSLWCQGYLLGFGLQLGTQSADNKEVAESLQDISKISQLEIASDESEDSQSALLIVVEHIKVAVKVIYLEIVLKQKTRGVAGNQTVH